MWKVKDAKEIKEVKGQYPFCLDKLRDRYACVI